MIDNPNYSKTSHKTHLISWSTVSNHSFVQSEVAEQHNQPTDNNDHIKEDNPQLNPTLKENGIQKRASKQIGRTSIDNPPLQMESKHLEFINPLSFQMVSKNLQIIKSSSLYWEVEPREETTPKQKAQVNQNTNEELACLHKDNAINYNQALLFLRHVDITSFNLLFIGHEGLSQSFMNEVRKMENKDMTESEFKELKTNLFEPMECANHLPVELISEDANNKNEGIDDDNGYRDHSTSEAKNPNEISTQGYKDKSNPIKVKVRKLVSLKKASLKSNDSPRANSPQKSLLPQDSSPKVKKKPSSLKKTIKERKDISNRTNKDKTNKATISPDAKEPKDIASRDKRKNKSKSNQKTQIKKSPEQSNRKQHALKTSHKSKEKTNAKPKLSTEQSQEKNKQEVKEISNEETKPHKTKLKKRLKPIKNASEEMTEVPSQNPQQVLIKKKTVLMKKKLSQLKKEREKSLPSTRCLSKSKGGCPSSVDSPTHLIKNTMKKNLSLSDLNYAQGNNLAKTTVSGEFSSLKGSKAKLLQSIYSNKEKTKPTNNLGHYTNINSLSKGKPLPIRDNSRPNSFLKKIFEVITNKLHDKGNADANSKTNHSNTAKKDNCISINKRKVKMIDDCCQTSDLYYPQNMNRLMSNITQHYFDNKMSYYKTIVSNPYSPYSSGYNFGKLNRRFNLNENQRAAQFPHFFSPQNKVLYRNNSSSLFELTSTNTGNKNNDTCFLKKPNQNSSENIRINEKGDEIASLRQYFKY